MRLARRHDLIETGARDPSFLARQIPQTQTQQLG